MSIYDDERSGRPSTDVTLENIGKVHDIIRTDRRQTIHDVCDIVGLSYGTVQCILADVLYMRRIAAKFVLRLLGDDQKQNRVTVCRQLREKTIDDPNFIRKIITGDELWFYGYDFEVKSQSGQSKITKESPKSKIKPSQSKCDSKTKLPQSMTQSTTEEPQSVVQSQLLLAPKTQRPRKPRHIRNKAKLMLIVFFDMQGIIHREYVPADQTVNSKFYCEVLERLCESIRCKRPNFRMDNDWVLHYDKTPAHTSITA